MDNESWLEWRRQGIGSSDAGVIMGVSPWRTPHELWQEKVYGNSVQLENSAMSRGKELEDVARRQFEKALGVTVFPRNVVRPAAEWLRASLDGIDMENKVLVEIKCPNKADHSTALGKAIPDKYWPQVQHQLLVTGLPGMYYYSFDGDKGVVVEVARDNAYIAAMLEEEQKFWDKVLAKEPPPLTDRDFIPMEGNKEWGKFAKRWAEVKAVLDKAEEEEKEIRGTLISLSNDRSAHGHGLKISKSVCPGLVDYKLAIANYLERLQSIHPGLAFPPICFEEFRKKPYTKWTFRDTKGNE